MSDETRLILEELGKLGPKLDSLGGKIDTEVSRLEAKLEAEVGRLEEKIGGLEEKIDTEVGRLEEKIDGLEEKIDTEVGRLEEKIGGLEKKIDGLEENIQMIRLQLENEISPNIRRVAEGHLDLSRNLHEAMKPNSEVEMLSIRVGILENRVKKLEQKIS